MTGLKQVIDDSLSGGYNYELRFYFDSTVGRRGMAAGRPRIEV